MSVPFGDEGHQAISQMSAIGEVTDLKPLALHNAEPLLDLIHPGTMCWQKVTEKAGMGGKPGLNTLPLMDAGVIEHEKDALYPGWGLPVKPSKQRDEFFLAFPQCCESRDLARPRIKSGEQVQSSSTLVFMLHTRRQARARRKRRGKTRARLQIRLFVEAQYPLPSSKWAGIKLNQKLHLLGKPLIARHGWRESHRWERHGLSL